MNRQTYRVLDMLASVSAFGGANAGEFPTDSLGGQAFAAIRASIEKMIAQSTQVNLTLGQARASTLGREAAREALTQQMDAISRASDGISIDIIGVERKFKMPDFPRR